METLSLFAVSSPAERKFQEFHAKNPQVYEMLVKLAREAHNAGRRKIGIKMLLEIVRWNYMLSTTDPDFKVNNNYAPRYARLIMDFNPELDGIFDTRWLHS